MAALTSGDLDLSTPLLLVWGSMREALYHFHPHWAGQMLSPDEEK